MAAAEQRSDVFVSYSHADAAWLKRVQVHLRPLVRDDQIDLWDDTLIDAGARWQEEIRSALAQARVAVLLISADFFASDFIATKELPQLLEAEGKRGLTILGVHINHSRFDRDKVLSEYQTINSPDRPIEGLPRSDQEAVFDALARRIEELLASPDRAAPRDGLDGVPLPPKPPRCIGREQEVETLVAALLAREPAAVLGPAGIGKSTVCLQALHDPRVAGRFGTRRHFARLDGAATAKDMLKGVAAVLGIPVDQASLGNVIGRLAEVPTALALDNLETPWQAETYEVEALLAQLAAAPGSSLTVTLRRGNQPGGVAWREPIEVKPLGREDARRVFLAVAGDKHAANAQLGELLTVLDGVPLAIELLAYTAQAEPDLEGLWQRWQTERTAMLKRGTGDHRLLNLAVSLELSIAGPGMTDPARRLLTLLGLLPDGIARGDLETLLPGFGNAAAATLRQVALAFDEARRLRTLAPIREHLATHHPPVAEDLARGIDHYAGLARDLGPKSGKEGGADAVAGLAAETANIEQMLLAGLNSPEPRSAVGAASAFAEFQRFSGLGTTQPLDAAIEASKPIDDALAANALFWRGVLALARSDHDGARERYEEALPLYRRVGAVLGEANCIQSLGDLALARSDHDGARERYEAALPLYRRVGDVLGEANCIKSLGNIALARSDHDGARERYEAALGLYRRVGAVLGEANCINSLGNIALARSDHDGARERYEEALPLYRRVGDVLGEANCIYSRGDIARARSDHDRARERYEAALPLYRRVGDVLGEANCIQSLGDIALARSDHDRARERYEAALPLYRRVGDVLGEANCIKSLGDIARARSDHDGARERYEVALPLYRRVGAVLGEANCINSLGDIALRRSDHDGARERYEAALPLYRRVGDVLGEANCILSLGDIALARSDHDGARERYEEALPLYRRVGAVLGEANCINSLGDIALRRSDHDGARERYEAALPLYRRVGDVLGEANCILSLGDIALARSDHDGARERYEAALGLYIRVQRPYSMGRAHKALADIARHDDERARHLAAARAAWLSIGRDDLVREWLDGSGGPTG